MELREEVIMYVERYILNYVERCHLSRDKIREDIGIDLEKIDRNQLELTAEEFIKLCMYLQLSPEEITEWMLLNR